MRPMKLWGFTKKPGTAKPAADDAASARRKAEAAKKTQTGAWGENVAAKFLADKGYAVMDRRVRLGRDEIDIVAVPPKEEGADRPIVFVEVKTRRSSLYGGPYSAITAGKKRAIMRASIKYIRKMRYKEMPMIRYDVITVLGAVGMDAPEVNHVIDAFRHPRSFFTNRVRL